MFVTEHPQVFVLGFNCRQFSPPWIPEWEERFFRQTRARRSNGEDKGGDPEGGVDGDEGGAEGGRSGLAAQQQDEAEETNHKLEKNK